MTKNPKVALAALLIGCMAMGTSTPAHAQRQPVSESIVNYGDLSMLYQAVQNTGLDNELRSDINYTIFAPTNAAFAFIQPQIYPCFYALECRTKISMLLRNHIIVGRHQLKELTTYPYGVQTTGHRRVLIEQPYLGQFTVDGRTILSKSDINGNIIYRVDGVLAGPLELNQFKTVSTLIPDSTMTTQRTVTTYTTSTPDDPDLMEPESLTEKTTVIQTTRTRP